LKGYQNAETCFGALPCVIGNFALIGPSIVITNDKTTRLNPYMEVIKPDEWIKQPIKIGLPSPIGANVTLVRPITVGEFALIGADSVVNEDLAPNSLVLGNLVRHKNWVGKNDHNLDHGKQQELFVDKLTNESFAVLGDKI
jgi:acetyltransferase-like isoleucine patch superfamily enzyme